MEKDLKYQDLAKRLKKGFLQLREIKIKEYAYTNQAAGFFLKGAEYFMNFNWKLDLSEQSKLNCLFECLLFHQNEGKVIKENIFVSSILWNKWLPDYLKETPDSWIRREGTNGEKVLNREELQQMVKERKRRSVDLQKKVEQQYQEYSEIEVPLIKYNKLDLRLSEI